MDEKRVDLKWTAKGELTYSGIEAINIFTHLGDCLHSQSYPCNHSILMLALEIILCFADVIKIINKRI